MEYQFQCGSIASHSSDGFVEIKFELWGIESAERIADTDSEQEDPIENRHTGSQFPELLVA